MSPLIGMLVSSGKATLIELQTSYGIKDAYDLLEIVAVDLTNQKKVMARKPGARS